MTEEPLEIEILPEEDDNMISCKKLCPKKKSLINDLMQSELFHNEDDQKLYQYFTSHSQMSVHNLETAFYLNDGFVTEAYYNMTPPNWTHDGYLEKLEKLADLYFLSKTYTPELAMLEVGPLWYRIMGFLEEGTKPGRSANVFLISGHQETIYSILNSIQALDNRIISFSSCVTIELHEKPEDGFYLKFFFKNHEGTVEIKNSSCSSMCDIYKFYYILKNIVITQEEWNNECDFNNSFKINSLVIVLIFANLTVLSVLSVFLYRHFRSKLNLIKSVEKYCVLICIS